MTIIKMCGVMTLDDAIVAVGAGAHMIGLNFYEPSPRYILPETGRHIATALRTELGEQMPLIVGVFVNADVEAIKFIMGMAWLDYAQLSGDEGPDVLQALEGRAFKALRPRDVDEALMQVETFQSLAPADRPRAPSLLLDAYHKELYGGTGEQASTEIALAVRKKTPRMMLAGGLTPENVGERVAAIKPWGVDVASGIEIDGQKGRKDRAKMRAFVEAVQSAESSGIVGGQ